MLDRWFGHNTHYYLHLLGLAGVAVGLPLSKVVLSISTMFLLLNLLLKADFKAYWEQWSKNRMFHLILLFFLLHFVALLWSEDISYGLHDIRKKIPFIIIPLVATAIPFRDKEDRDIILYSFVGAVVITSVINFAAYQNWFGGIEVVQFRDMSLFTSHVRYSLLVVVAIAIAYQQIIHRRFVYFSAVIILWLGFYTLYSQVIAGFIALVATLFVVMFYHFYPKRKVILYMMSGLGIILLITVMNWLFYSPQIDHGKYLSELDRITSEGNKYTHDLTLISPETEKPIGEYVCMDELTREWNKVSNMPLEAKDKKGQPLWQTLIRYLSSMDVRKDAEGFHTLNKHDIHKIENGCASQYCAGIIARMYGLKYQILNEKDPNGHSLLQRIEYWKAGGHILSENFITGVGTGDVQHAFDEYYSLVDSPLSEENRLRAHNYYITIFLTFGILGIVLFGWLHVEFFRTILRNFDIVAMSFLIILLSSYLTEDTLETQVGVTFFAFFISLYIQPEKS